MWNSSNFISKVVEDRKVFRTDLIDSYSIHCVDASGQVESLIDESKLIENTVGDIIIIVGERI